MKVKVSETTRIQLDWMVAKCENILGNITQAKNWGELCKQRGGVVFTHRQLYSPTNNWAHGGPIIEEMLKSGVTTWNFLGECFFELAEENILQKGSTPLIAGLRCYVASKLGDEVEVPDELI